MAEPLASGRCEVCGAKALFRQETRCWRHPVITRVVVTLAGGQRLELPGPPPEPEAAA